MSNPIRDILEGIADDMTFRETMQKHLLYQRQAMMERTQNWKDVYGRVFAEYSEQHRQRRVDLGLAVRPVQGADSMLVMDSYDGMMQRIDDVIKGNTAEIFFNDEAKKAVAKAHNILGVGKKKVKREFFGISEDEEQWHADEWEKDLNDSLQRLSAQFSQKDIDMEDLTL